MRAIDDELRRRFAELRETDRESMPEFSAMRDAARRREPRARNTSWMLAAAAAVLVVGAGAGLRWKARRPVPDPTLTISSWSSPTASLLQTPVAGIAPPSILGSVLDGLSSARTLK